MKHYLFALSLILILIISLAACTGQPDSITQAPAKAENPGAAAKEIILATTTSTQDSGLLDVLIPDFQQKTGYTVKTVAVGTGQALQMGTDCNADVLLVHAPSSEEDFMAAGNGLERKLVMHTDFILVGPADDPAGIKGTATAAEALQKIHAAKAAFISRGDDSGTHMMELSLWKKAEITPEGKWYIESGQGMAPTLKIASEKNAYTLTDRATYLANKAYLSLEIMLEGDAALLNVYHVIIVNPQKCTQINLGGARAFADYIVSAETQALIGKFGVDKFGQSLFYPDAGKTDQDLGLP